MSAIECIKQKHINCWMAGLESLHQCPRCAMDSKLDCANFYWSYNLHAVSEYGIPAKQYASVLSLTLGVA